MRTKWLIAVLLLAGLAGLTACGKKAGAADGIASATGKGATATPTASGSAGQAKADGVKFAQCMRQHGVNMPDPKVNSSGGIGIMVPQGTSKSTVDKAQQACKQYLPNGGVPPKMDPAVTEQLRQLAKCMRANGVPKFPDPAPNGGIQIDGRSGIDPNDPVFQAAQKKCDKYGPKRVGGGPDGSAGQTTEQHG
jgi:hypothetical protein